MKRHGKNRVLELQRQALASKASEALITLGILRDVFDASDNLMKEYYEKFRTEVNRNNVWTPQGLRKAMEEFKRVAKTYNVKALPVPDVYLTNDRERLRLGSMSEVTCLFITLRILRENVRFTYDMLDRFLESYIDFGKVYEVGEQVDLEDLSADLAEIIGTDIFKGVVNGH